VEKFTGGAHVSDVVADRVAAPLGVAGECYLGRVPAAADARLARMEPPRRFRDRRSAAAAREGAATGTPRRRFEVAAAARLESRLFVWISNSTWFRRISLPSSNCYVSARAAGRVFASLADALADRAGARVVSKATLDVVTLKLRRAPRVPCKHPDGDYADVPARYASGFHPWYDAELHGAHAAETLGHTGQGGCAVWLDVHNDLVVAILKNTFEPLSIAGGGTSPDAIRVAATIRRRLGLGG